jgi:glutamate N-acetyltransferase/amino-acid N-acetyltransferase
VAATSFNRITIDGDTSTNDSFIVIATGRAPTAPIVRSDDSRLRPLHDALEVVAVQLAQAIVRDGEGATKFITITVDGGRDVGECDRVARAIAAISNALSASDEKNCAAMIV